jgi:hypothetical protein
MTVTATRDKSIEIDVSERYFTVYGSLAFGAASTDTYVTGGVTLNLGGIAPGVGSSKPVEVSVWSESATLGNPLYKYLPGTNATDGKLQLYGANGPAAGVQSFIELANALAMNNAALNIWGDTPKFSAKFRKGR